MTVRYTPGQLRSATGIAPETYRHWKKALRPLRSERGHSPCFGLGDLVAVSVVQVLTTDLGVRVSALSEIADHLFEVCNATAWPALERGNLVLASGSARVMLVPDLQQIAISEAWMVVPLSPIVAALREQLLPGPVDMEQSPLRFPPHGLVAKERLP
jgi:hypothetical protein